MSRQLKTMITAVYDQRFAGVEEACVVDVTGLTVDKTIEVRNALRDKNMRLTVVKNSLARRSFAGGPLEPVGNALAGPCALVTGGDSSIEIAKAMVSLAKSFPKLKLKEGIIPGDTEMMPVADLAKMQGRMELLGEIAGLVSSPGRAVAGCLSSPQSKIAGCLKAMIDKE